MTGDGEEMKIVTLVENTPGTEGCAAEHGLSIYIETKAHKILLDTGASDAFLRNSVVLGINLKEVDMLVLSHGHYDHGGGITEFVQINPSARIYMRPSALQEYYHLYEKGAKYIGLDKEIGQLSRICYTEEEMLLDQGILLFSGVSGRKMWPKGNHSLKCLKGDVFTQDTFDHEQSLVVREDGASILLSGCAHNGIVNILERYEKIFGGAPDIVVTGFHMKKNGLLTEEEKAVVKATALELKRRKHTVFYSGHCTGEEAFYMMKEIMGAQLMNLYCGREIL